MNTEWSTRLVRSLLALLTVMLTAATGLRAQESPRLALRLVYQPETHGGFLFVTGPAATNFVLESSIDLRTWIPVFQAYCAPGTNPVHRVSVDWPARPHAFWRARSGEALSAQEQRWRGAEPVEYTFRFRHLISFWEGGVRGTVRVRRGVVIEVSDAVDDRTLEPIAQPVLSRFLTLTQLYEEIRREFESGSQSVQVRYDAAGLYPEWIYVDRLLGAADDESVYEAGEWVVLQR